MKPETIAVRGDFVCDPATKAVATPIYQTVAYRFDNAQHGADLFDLKVEGNIYSRIMNPTCGFLERRLAALEGGIGALALSSGMAAVAATVNAICEAGDNIVSVSQLYGGSYNFFAHSLPRMGIETRMFDADDPAAAAALIDDRTRMIFCESIGNPALNVVDLEALAAVASRAGVPLVVDNTVATPILCRPFDFGAHIVVHSLTKYIGGHGTTVGGAIVDSGKFPWADNPRFAILNRPDPSYHGLVYTEALGAAAFIGRARVAPLRSMGGALSPHSAFLLMQGLETLPLRMARHVENARAVCDFLSGREEIAEVRYAGLAASKHFDLAKKYVGGKPSGILAFRLRGGFAAGVAFIDALKLILQLVNIGDAKTLACHPASTTHRQLSPAEQAAAGVSPDLIRLSIGIEHIDDIVADLDQALAAARQAAQ